MIVYKSPEGIGLTFRLQALLFLRVCPGNVHVSVIETREQASYSFGLSADNGDKPLSGVLSVTRGAESAGGR